MGNYARFGLAIQSISIGNANIFLNRDKSYLGLSYSRNNPEDTKYVKINRWFTSEKRLNQGWYQYKKGNSSPIEILNIKLNQFEKPAIQIKHK